MAKIKFTKNELKRQKEDLKRFNRYLPMLQLKKQQLQLEIAKAHRAIETAAGEASKLRGEVTAWADVFAQEVNLSLLLKVKTIKVDTGNIAGLDIPLFLDAEFTQPPYDLMRTPLWVDKAIEVCKQKIILKAKLLIYHRQEEILKEELRITTQRVNLFEKIKIPSSRENIRVINIYLGELQKAGVVRGKIAKAKIDKHGAA